MEERKPVFKSYYYGVLVKSFISTAGIIYKHDFENLIKKHKVAHPLSLLTFGRFKDNKDYKSSIVIISDLNIKKKIANYNNTDFAKHDGLTEGERFDVIRGILDKLLEEQSEALDEGEYLMRKSIIDSFPTRDSVLQFIEDNPSMVLERARK